MPAGTSYKLGGFVEGIFITWHVGTGFGPTAHVVTFIVSGVVDRPLSGEVQQPCRFTWTALIQ